MRLPRNFAVTGGGIFFSASSDPERRFEIRFYSFATRKTESVVRIEGWLGNGMAVAPDERSLLFPVEGRSGDLLMIENFR